MLAFGALPGQRPIPAATFSQVADAPDPSPPTLLQLQLNEQESSDGTSAPHPHCRLPDHVVNQEQ